MDNKKLLNFLLKDLTELDELFTDKKTGDFNALEMEFLETRIRGAKKLVQILAEREAPQVELPIRSELSRESDEEVVKVSEQPVLENLAEEVPPETVASELPAEELQTSKAESTPAGEKDTTTANVKEPPAEQPTEGIQPGRTAEDGRGAPEQVDQDDMELEDEDPADNPNKRLSDVFLKEKSVNDSVDGGLGKLEHKLSNRPVASIQSAIGINDRFQYIRELFNGKPDEFSKTVTALDSKNNIKEAVNYLQQNFKWKKNEASLKFVNLVKRRFTHD